LKKPQSSLYVGTREVADTLGISPNAVLAAIRRGDMPGVSLGKHFRIPKSYLESIKALAE